MNIKLELVRDREKPTIRLDNNKLYALFDTGADIPVWWDTIELLKICYPGVRLVNDHYQYIGAGGRSSGRLYQISFSLKGLTWPNLPIIVPSGEARKAYRERQTRRSRFCSMILSGTMFGDLDYSIRNKSRQLVIELSSTDQLERHIG